MSNKKQKRTVGIIGAGAWGTALALAAHRSGCKVVVWTYEKDHALKMQAENYNSTFLPNIKLPEDFIYTTKYEDLTACDFYILATPAQTIRSVLKSAITIIGTEKPVLLTSKGIEKNTCLLMSQVAQQVSPTLNISVLSGPSFAIDVANNLPTAITLASNSLSAATQLGSYLNTPNFRIYVSTDLIGLQVGGALKNVIALASGIAWGLNLGDNARAALITRGLVEIQRLGLAMGGKRETFMGLSGLGDLLLTCSSKKSRNTSLGIKLAQEKSLQSHGSLAEGLPTAESIQTLAKKYNVSMPICEEVYAFLQGKTTLGTALENLLNRPSLYEEL